MADEKIYISSDGRVHSTAAAAIEASQTAEQTSGQYVTGGNCGQDASNVQSDSGSDSGEKD